MTMRVLDLIDECQGFDNYILKVSKMNYLAFLFEIYIVTVSAAYQDHI